MSEAPNITPTPRPPLALARWIWRSYARTALVPLLGVELAIVGAYVVGTYYSHRQNVATLRSMARGELRSGVEREAKLIDEKLQGVAQLTALFGAEATRLMGPDGPAPLEGEAARLKYDENGVMYANDGVGASVFYSAVTPKGPEAVAKVGRLAHLDPLMVGIAGSNPLVRQAYINTDDSLNRIFPPMSDVSAYPPDMHIPSFNFYYEADAAHNPSREPVWTDAYLDPAGAGWIVSSIAPVYGDDRLLAVVGLDVTLETVIAQVLDLQSPWGGYGLLVDEAGVAIALPPAGEVDWGINELLKHEYAKAVEADTFKPDAFSLYKNPRLRELGRAVAGAPQGVLELPLGDDRIASWASVPGTGWRLVFVAPSAAVFAPADALQAEMLRIGYLMLAGMGAFYAVFFAVLYRRAQSQAADLSAPLLAMNGVVKAIGDGAYTHEPPVTGIAELADSGARIVALGARMGAQVAALREASADLNLAKEAAERANQVKGQFLANMSHEVRTPMNAILGVTDLVLAAELTPPVRRHAELIRSSGLQLMDILDDVLDVAAIDAGKLRIRPGPVSLPELLAELRALHAPLCDEKGLHLSVYGDRALPATVEIDGGRLRQIARNLLSNAVKYTPDGRIDVELRPLDPVTPGAPLTLELSVLDTGIGVDVAQQERIFDAFVQASEGNTRAAGGTGLGLTISRHLCRELGGDLVLQPGPGRGSRFVATVRCRVREGGSLAPAAPASLSPSLSPSPAPSPAPSLAPSAPTVHGLRVLAAEDMPVNRMILEALLEREGHSVTLAEDGLVALEAYQRGDYDLLLVDLQMPRMDGLSLIRAIRDGERGRRVPVLVVTANVTARDREQSLAAGADGFIGKPVSADALRAAMASVRRVAVA